MNYKELSDASGIKYDTVRNYAKVLLEEDLITEIDEKTVDIVKRMPDYTAEGLTVKEAAHKAVESKQKSTKSSQTGELQKKVEELEQENKELQKQLQQERDLIKSLREKLEALTGNDEKNTTKLAVYNEEISSTASSIKNALLSVSQGFAQFINWLFDTRHQDQEKQEQEEDSENDESDKTNGKGK